MDPSRNLPFKTTSKTVTAGFHVCEYVAKDYIVTVQTRLSQYQYTILRESGLVLPEISMQTLFLLAMHYSWATRKK